MKEGEHKCKIKRNQEKKSGKVKRKGEILRENNKNL